MSNAIHGADGADRKADVGGDTLDLVVKHVLLRDAAKGIRWLKDHGLIGRPWHESDRLTEQRGGYCL